MANETFEHEDVFGRVSIRTTNRQNANQELTRESIPCVWCHSGAFQIGSSDTWRCIQYARQFKGRQS